MVVLVAVMVVAVVVLVAVSWRFGLFWGSVCGLRLLLSDFYFEKWLADTRCLLTVLTPLTCHYFYLPLGEISGDFTTRYFLFRKKLIDNNRKKSKFSRFNIHTLIFNCWNLIWNTHH
jgi:hypothetical protein